MSKLKDFKWKHYEPEIILRGVLNMFFVRQQFQQYFNFFKQPVVNKWT